MIKNTFITRNFVRLSAINQTEVKVTFSSDAGYDEEGLKGKEITLTAGENTLTATYKADSLNEDGEATFSLSEDSLLVHGTEYTVSGEGFTFENAEFTYQDAEVVALEKAIADAEAAIEALPTEEISLADKQDVVDARTLVDAALALDENADIQGLDKLATAEEAIKTLEAEKEAAEELAAAVTAAQDAIEALPAVEELTLENAEAVEAARELVNQVIDLGGEDTDVENLEVLEALEDQIEVLQAQAEVDAAVATAQEAVDALTLASATNVDSQEKVEAAQALVQPAKDAIAAVTALDAEYDVTALNNAVATAETNIANAEAVLAAKGLVATAQETLLDEDYDAAKEAVDALENSDAKTLENARLIELEAERAAIVKAVNDANNQVELFDALQQAPFKDTVSANIKGYQDALADLDNGKATSITEVQGVIDAANTAAENISLEKKVNDANNAVNGLPDFYTADADKQKEFEDAVAETKTAIDALPADYKENEEDEKTLVAILQAELDEEIQLNTDFVSKVKPVVTAVDNQIEFNSALKAAGIKNVKTSNIVEYINAIKSIEDEGAVTLLEEIQYVVDFENAKQAVSNLTITDADSELLALAEGVGQKEISAAKALVEALPNQGDVDEETGEKAVDTNKQGLLADVATAQEFIDALNIKDQKGLKAALDNENIVELKLADSFETTEKINIFRSVNIDGGDNTIIFAGNEEGWQGNYVLQVYNETEEVVVNISNIKLTGGDAGLLVNGANVVLEGTIDVSDNEYGGIESGKGSNVQSSSTLDVTNATLVNTTEAYGLPTIWEDEVTNTVIGVDDLYEIEKGEQPQYYLVEENSIDPLPTQQEAAQKAAEEAIATLPTVGELTLEDTESVEAARDLVKDALALNVQAEIAGSDTLVALEEQLVTLEDQAEVAEILSAKTATELQPLLVKLAQDEYNNLTSTQRHEVAELFLAEIPVNGYVDTAAAAEALVDLVGVPAVEGTPASGYYALLAVVNDATSITSTRDALSALGNETFDAMSASEKLVAAENVLNAKPDSGYTSITQIANNFASAE